MRRTIAVSLIKRALLPVAQWMVIISIRPYVRRELTGWGRIYHTFVGDYRRDWFWVDSSIKSIREKNHGYVLYLDLAKWSDRSAYFLGRWYDLATQLMISDLIEPGDTVIDVGCNRGMFALMASRLVGAKGKVICFDPNPNCTDILEQHIEINEIKNIIVHRFGLGDRADVLVLHVPVNNTGEGTFGRPAYGSELTYKVLSTIRRGDEFMAAEAPSFIKIDAEGYEYNVLRGLDTTIRLHQPVIMTEMVSRHLHACGATVAQVLDLLRDFGYQGFMLRLAKEHGRYRWKLVKIKDDNELEGAADFDAVWINPLAAKWRAGHIKAVARIAR